MQVARYNEVGRSMRKVGMREYGMCTAAVTTRAAVLVYGR